MEIRQLRYFVETARQGNIQDAANALFVSRQAVSKSLSQLEEELGYPLFYRTHGGVTLSEQGRGYLDLAAALLQGFDTLEAQMRQTQEKDTLQIAIPFTVHHYFFDRLMAFAEQNSDSLDLIPVNRTDAECHTLFESGAVDMAISHLPFTAGIDEGRIIAVSPICIAMRKDHPLAGRTLLKDRDLLGQSLIYYMNGYLKCFWLDEKVPAPAYAVHDILLAYELVYQGRGIFPVPPLSMPSFTKDIVLVPFEGLDDKDYFCCAIARHTAFTPRLQHTCLALREALTEIE